PISPATARTATTARSVPTGSGTSPRSRPSSYSVAHSSLTCAVRFRRPSSSGRPGHRLCSDRVLHLSSPVISRCKAAMNPIHLRVEPLEDRLTPVTLPPGFNESLLCAGLTNPTSMTLAPDGRIFVSEQGGTLRVIENGVLLPTPFVSLTVGAGSERGLLGIAFDPNFAANGFVYVYYTVPESGATAPHNRVSRFTASGNVAVA